MEHKQLKHRQSDQISGALGISRKAAYKILSGIVTPAGLAKRQQQKELEKQRKEAMKRELDRTRGRAKRRQAWMQQAVAALAAIGVPAGMAFEVIEPYAYRTSDSFNIGAQPEPAESAALRLWNDRVATSGFAAASDLIAAWQEARVWTAAQLQAAREWRTRVANAGMLPERIAELCAPERIENTLRSVFHINHWAKARERLLYADRQGLYLVKARLLREAYNNGQIQAVAYLAQKEFDPFRDLGLDFFLEIFAEDLADPQAPRFPQVCKLYRLATGEEIPEPPEPPNLSAIERFVRERLEELVRQAEQSRQPIPTEALANLLLRPDDIPSIAYDEEGNSRWNYTPAWEDLEDVDLASLDPEWKSLVAFRYESANARYRFHLPFRVAEQFIPAAELRQLQANGAPREEGESFGREITEAESMKHPIEELLQELGVEVGAVCPKRLVDKQEYLAEKARAAAERRMLWEWEHEHDDEDWEDDEDLEEMVDRLTFPHPSKRKKK